MSKRLSQIRFRTPENAALLDIFARTILTEKTFRLEAEQNCMSFGAPDWANKDLVRACFEKVFGCRVYRVSVLNVKFKNKNLRGRIYKKPGYKKFHVRVDDPNKIAGVLR